MHMHIQIKLNFQLKIYLYVRVSLQRDDIGYIDYSISTKQQKSSIWFVNIMIMTHVHCFEIESRLHVNLETREIFRIF